MNETLLTAARRVVRFFKIDENHGGLMSIDTIKAVDELDRQVLLEAKRQNVSPEPPPAEVAERSDAAQESADAKSE